MKSETDNLSDSQYLKIAETFKDKHREDMKQISRLAKSAKKEKKPSWFSRLKTCLGFRE